MTQIDTNVSPYLANAYAHDRKHVFHSWSAQGALNPAVVTRAQGSEFSGFIRMRGAGHGTDFEWTIGIIEDRLSQAAALCAGSPEYGDKFLFRHGLWIEKLKIEN